MCRKNQFAWISLGLAALLFAAAVGDARALTPATVALPESVAPVDAAPASTTTSATRPYISRQALTSAETSAPMTFEIALKMRSFAELQARVSRGERVSPQEMADKYEPQAADYQAVVGWLKGEGFTIVRQDPRHLSVLVRGKVGHVASALKVTFARVKANGKEYTSAITAPSVPVGISPLLIGINGLQPHIRAHKHLIRADAQPNASSGGASYAPSQIATAYGVQALYNAKITGAGQTIAIVIDTFPSTSDLLLFWKNCSVNQSISNIQFVQPDFGITLDQSSQGVGEETLDTEWSSAMAPGAHIRIYAAPGLEPDDLDTAYQQIITDATNHPELGIHQMSMSYGIGETDAGKSQVETDDALFVELANLGITAFASSGDYGTTPDIAERSNSIQVESPASDPNVTAVGGTSLQLNPDNTISQETVWNTFSKIGNSVSGGTSGGGVSAYFAAPSFQSGTMREVPDVAASADPTYGAIIYFNGVKTVVGGTSWASPTWAALCALMNQARADAGQAPLGLLGPHVYGLVDTANFNDIGAGTSSGNGGGNNSTRTGNGFTAYNGYDEATGIGTPNTATIAQTLLGSAALTGVQMAAPMQSVTPGQNATFAVSVGGGTASFQWQRKALGATAYSSLSDTTTYSGSSTGSLTITGATEAMSGDSFQCIVTLAGATVTTTPSVLVVDSPLIISALAGAVGTAAPTDGSGSQASFNIPSGIALDASGNLYIADFSNNSIREVTPGGTVTTPYGSTSGTAGKIGTGVTSADIDGKGNSALFYQPNSVTVDPSGNLYVADTGNNLIRKVTIKDGAVVTYAGTNREFNTPEGVATDSAGNVYVADTFNDCIKKVDTGGNVTTVAGQAATAGYQDGAATRTALFNLPASLAVDGAGNIYVADTGNCVIRKIDTGGNVTTVAGQAITSGYLDGPAAAALFNWPAGITLDSFGNIYVADALAPSANENGAGNDVVRRITTAGAVSTLAGQPGNAGAALGTGAAALFYSMQAVAINNTTGEFYLADTYNNVIREGLLVPTVGLAVSQEAMVFGPTPGQFTVTRSGSPLGSVTLNYTLAGTAVAGTDYQALPTSVTLPFGASSAAVTVNPIADSQATSSPTLQLTLGSSATYLPGSSSSATMTIQEVTHYQSYSAAVFGSNATNSAIGVPTADPNHNGVPNLLEYAFNSDPTQTGTEPLPVISTMQDGNNQTHLAITYNELNTDPKLSVTVQVTSDLTQQTDTWHSGAAYTTVVGTPTVSGTTTTTTVMDRTPVPAGSHRFIRIQVMEN